MEDLISASSAKLLSEEYIKARNKRLKGVRDILFPKPINHVMDMIEKSAKGGGTTVSIPRVGIETFLYKYHKFEYSAEIEQSGLISDLVKKLEKLGYSVIRGAPYDYLDIGWNNG